MLTTVPASSTEYTDPGPFVPGQQYLYELVATNQIGSSAPTAAVPVQVFIASPAMTLTNVDASSISLSWTGVANDHYDIERSTDGVNFTVVGTVPASQTTFTDTGLSAGAYAYRIRAFNSNPDASSVSNVEGATVGPVIDQSGGFVNTSGLTANGSAQFAENTARLTNANDQTGSVFTNNRLTIGSFTTSFTIRLHEGTQPDYADGLTFVIQADSPTQLGQGTGGMGYQDIAQQHRDQARSVPEPRRSLRQLDRSVCQRGRSVRRRRHDRQRRAALEQPGDQAGQPGVRRHDAHRDDHEHARPE